MRFIKLWISVIALFSLTAFGLTGCGGGGGGGGSVPIPVPTAPAAPTGVQAVGGANQNTISWTAVSGATSYNLYWSTTPGVTTASNKIPGVTSPYVQIGLAAGTTYFYAVTAVNAVGESALSSEVSAKTIALSSPPTNVSATPGNTVVDLAWTAVTGATSYNIYFSPGDPNLSTSTGTRIPNLTGTSFHQTGLTNGTTYYYIMTAVVDGIESAPSPVLSAVPAVNPTPAAPSVNLQAFSFNLNGTQNISISWAAVPGATSYNAYYSDSPGVTPQNGTKFTGVTSTFRPQLPLGTYYFIITAVNANGESTASPQMAILVPIFTNELVSGKTLTYNDLQSGQLFVFTCQPNGSFTYTSSLSGVPASGNGLWLVNSDGTLTLTLSNASSLTFGYEVLSIRDNGATVGVTFTKGTAAATPGIITIR